MFGTPGDDNLVGTPVADIIAGFAGSDHLTGLDGNDVLIGGPDGDVLSGLAGDDLLTGDAGNDELLGGDGRDTLSGGPGEDILEGNAGADLLVGGPGADRFFFVPQVTFDPNGNPVAAASDTGLTEGSTDVVVDFRQGSDLILLAAYNVVDFRPSSPPNPAAPVFLGTGAFTADDTALQVRYSIEHGHTTVEFLGPTLPDSVAAEGHRLHGEIELLGVHHLAATDFVLS
jgi:Ca2+-binding RTX toxin-like protein